MNQTILFTPVGGTDPISSTNCKDGSMLHICRFYKPNKVIMYMSKEMLDYQEEDDRYRYCLNNLAKNQKREMEYQIIERKELTNVHEFDYFYQDFRKIIYEIYEKMDTSDTLLLNVSSGTPAMKSGLLVLQTLGEFPAKVIQVATPEKKINEHYHKDYDVKTLWELDEDNEEGAENRCKEIECPTLSKIKKEEIIKKHILAYDYKAALDVADTLEKLKDIEIFLPADDKYMYSICVPADGTGDYMKLCEKPLIINVQYYSGEKMYKERFELPMKGINCLINTSNYVRMEQKKRERLDEIGKQLEKIASET